MPLPRLIFVNRVYWPAEAATAQLLTDLAEGLAARGWPVHIIAAGGEAAECAGVTIHRTGPQAVHGGALSRLANYAGFLCAARRQLVALAAPGAIVVLMTDPPLLAAAATSVAQKRGARVVHWIQDIYPEIVPALAGAWAAAPLAPLKWARNRAWRAASRCVTVGRDMAATVAAQGIDAPAVIPNWAPRELHPPPASEALAAQRAAWGLADQFIAAYSGNLGRVHEFTTLLDAAEHLRGQPGIVFLFIGSGRQLPVVRAAAGRRGLPNVRFLPPQPRANLAASLAAADVHLVTLRSGFERLVYPSKLAGALAAGRPVLFVGPKDGEIARLIAKDDCGFAFAPKQAREIADALVQLRDTAPLRSRLGPCARACYERHFTAPRALDGWENLFRALA